MKITIVKTLTLTIEVNESDKEKALAVIKEIDRNGDFDLSDMHEEGTAYQIESPDNEFYRYVKSDLAVDENGMLEVAK